MRSLPILLLMFVLGCAQAQQQQPVDEFQKMRQQMLEMQRLMLQQFQNMDGFQMDIPFNDPGFAFPDGALDSSFFFKIDTTINGTHMQFFRFGPGAADGNFFQFGQPDDGYLREDDSSDDGLLPEERLRRRNQTDEEQSADEQDLLPEERLRRQRNEAPAKQQPKLKTTRI